MTFSALRPPHKRLVPVYTIVVVVITYVFQTITIVLYRGFSSKVSRAVQCGRPVVVIFSSPGDPLPLSIDCHRTGPTVRTTIVVGKRQHKHKIGAPLPYVPELENPVVMRGSLIKKFSDSGPKTDVKSIKRHTRFDLYEHV